MTPREVIEQALIRATHKPFGTTAVIEALHAAGFSIIHDSENHGPTVERAAEIAWSCVTGLYAASCIRAMTTGGQSETR